MMGDSALKKVCGCHFSTGKSMVHRSESRTNPCGHVLVSYAHVKFKLGYGHVPPYVD